MAASAPGHLFTAPGPSLEDAGTFGVLGGTAAHGTYNPTRQ